MQIRWSNTLRGEGMALDAAPALFCGMRAEVSRSRGEERQAPQTQMTQYPRTIENGGGERLTFTGRTNGPEGERVHADGTALPGAGPPMHVHLLQDEFVRVESGRVGHQVLGGEPQFAGPGDEVLWKAGTVHRWWNAGDGEARMVGWCSPPGNVEYYLAEVFRSMQANGGRQPGLFDAAFLTVRYRREFVMTEIPWMVRRVVLPIVCVLGHALGKYGKYKDAPPPL